MTQTTLAEAPGALASAFVEGDPASAAKTQEQANVEIVGAMIGAIAAGQFDSLRSVLADDVTFTLAAPPEVPWVRRAYGPDDVIAAIATNFGTVRDQRPGDITLVAQGDTVMVMASETGCFCDTGAEYQIFLAHQFTFRDGKLAAFRSVSAPA